MTFDTWLDRHNYTELPRCSDPAQAWNTCADVSILLRLLRDIGYAEHLKLRSFAAWLARRSAHLVPPTNVPITRCLDTADAYGAGLATEAELRKAHYYASLIARGIHERGHASVAFEAANAVCHACGFAWRGSDRLALSAITAASQAAEEARRALHIDCLPPGAQWWRNRSDVWAREAAAQVAELRRRIPWAEIEPLFAAALATA